MPYLGARRLLWREVGIGREEFLDMTVEEVEDTTTALAMRIREENKGT